MEFKNILKEFKENTYDKLDETILRQYSKITKKWEEKGHSRYSLAASFSFPNFFIVPLLEEIFIYSGYTCLLGFNVGIDFVGLMGYNTNGTKSDSNQKQIITNPIHYYANKITKEIRMPLFLIGSYLVGKSAFDFHNYLSDGEFLDFNQTKQNLIDGLSFLASSSSIYFRHSDPKVLEKQPMWKQAYKSLKEKLNNLLPHPSPEPSPVNNFSLEDKLR